MSNPASISILCVVNVIDGNIDDVETTPYLKFMDALKEVESMLVSELENMEVDAQYLVETYKFESLTSFDTESFTGDITEDVSALSNHMHSEEFCEMTALLRGSDCHISIAGRLLRE
jgi:hypothetical protein